MPRFFVSRIMSFGIALLTFGASFAPATAGQSASKPIEPVRSQSTQRNADGFRSLNATCPVDKAKELMITDLSVVEDCWRTTWGPCIGPPAFLPATRGAWTFGALIAGVAGTNDPLLLNRFVRDWLAHWQNNIVVNGDPVPARLFINQFLIQPWEAVSGSKILDMRKAPFRLLAIVNRVDLRNAPAGYGQPGTAGEARFVFGVLDANFPAGAPEFTVIFEYGLDSRHCPDTLDWANAFHALGGIKFGDRFNAELETITNRFATIGTSPDRPNGSSINQIRTNEITLASPWELREFQLVRDAFVAPAPLVQTTVAQTPDFDLQSSALLANYVNTDTPAILAGTHTVPASWLGTPFLGGASPHSLQLGWDGPVPCTSIPNLTARHLFSLATCSGCHGTREAGTRFYHIFPRTPGTVSVLSTFLTGGGGVVTDSCGLGHTFDDLERRAQDLCNLITHGCLSAEETALSPSFVH